ncbi:serine/threonine-protein kinase ZRK1-like, partial [Brassica napus]|uniref:serine/threonine-protein kinase ZRK1-like n=1 Tax=Brassica napus TaxID=3708 RepID=UPI00207A0B14
IFVAIWYKGDTEGRSYVIKKFTRPVGGEEEHAYKDIVLSARVSNNNGFLKLIGCCLEFPHPLMVFEDVEYKALNIRGSLGSEDVPVSPWNVLLKITKEVATAITYLHTAFPRIIIHKDIKATNIFLDKNWKAKLTDFSLAVTLPAGKSWIKDRVSGTPGYLDSTYSSTGSIVTEYADVYSFGILMLVLLMGRRPDMDGPEFTYYILDYARDLQERGELIEFGGGSKDMRPGQKKMFLDLALRCCAMRNEDMPKMILVAKEILVTSITLRIHQNIPPSSINVAEKFAEVGGDISQMSRNATVIQRK